MSCTGCSNDTSAGTGASGTAFDAAFGRFWPAGLPGPRLLPWLGAAVSRDDARAWALAIGADRDPGVLAGDEQAMLHLIGLAMGGGGVFAEERKGRKGRKKNDPQTDCDWSRSTSSCRLYLERCKASCDESGMNYSATCVALCDGTTTGESCDCLPRSMMPHDSPFAEDLR